MRYRVDAMSLRDGVLLIEGWCIPYKTKKIEYLVEDTHGKPMKCTAVARDRADVASQYGADRMSGFTVAVPFEREDDGWLIMRDGDVRRRVRINARIVEKKNSVRTKRYEKLLALVHFETLVVSWDFIRENGFGAFVKKAVHKIQKIDEDYDYPEWQLKTGISEEELQRQRETWKDFDFGGNKPPLISIVIPAYNTPEKYLRMLFDSILAQTYPHFEVVVADGSDMSIDPVGKSQAKAKPLADDGKNIRDSTAAQDGILTRAQADTAVAKVTGEYAKKDPRFKLLNLGQNLGISGNTNVGLKEARGDYAALVDHDDELPPEALFKVVEAISKNPKAQFIYTDEDKIDFDGKALFEPHFKPDMNTDLLCSVNYICHLSVIRRDLLKKVGGFDEEFDGAQDHDFFLRCLEEATREERKALMAYRDKLSLQKESGDPTISGIINQASDMDGASTDGMKERAKVRGDYRADFAHSSFPHIDIDPVQDRDIGRDTDPSPDTLALDQEAGTLSADALKKLKEGRFVSETVVHVPYVCYHWRFHKGSTALDPKTKLYAYEAGERAIKAHYEREGIKYKDVEKGVTYGYYHTVYEIPEDPPLVSVIIPNKDHVDDLKKAIKSIDEHSTYRNLEFVIVENNSEESGTFKYYEKLEKGNGISLPVHVVRWEREFNYSAINNFGVKSAKGDIILFLNNDVELINPDALTEMVNLALRPDTGLVGAKLTYGDDTVQHAGVIVGLGGIAGAAFIGLHEKENSYMHRMMCTQELSAVTAACMMMRKDVFELAGGFREELAVAFNDIDLCMKVRTLGLNVIYDPYASFHHYESRTRGLEDTPEKVQRFNGEIAVFAQYWGEILEHGDPYYNPNLTLRKANFALRDLTHERPGQPYKLELDVDKQLRIVEREKQRRGL